MDLKKLANQYKDELLNNVLPFWLEHSQDHEYVAFTIQTSEIATEFVILRML